MIVVVITKYADIKGMSVIMGDVLATGAAVVVTIGAVVAAVGTPISCKCLQS